ncbi:MAG: ABC transporter permease [Caldimonas sp.]
MTAPLAQLLRLAWADLRHDGLLSACSILLLAASLAPLLTLHGLENGVIGALVERLDKDPAMRLVIPEVTGSQRYDLAWFDAARRWPEVEFAIPNTRAIAGLVDLVAGTQAAGTPLQVSLLPTAAGDPVLAGQAPPATADRLVLSSSAARKLGVAAGAQVTAVIERVRDGRSEPVLAVLGVAGVLPAERHEGDAGFVALAFVEAVQAYRDGHAVAALGWPGDAAAPPVESYPLFRLYARSIGEVGVLVKRLQGQGISLLTRDREIASTLGLQGNLRSVLAIVSALAGLGYAVAMVALQIATVRRKRREYAVLKLIGYGRRWLMALPSVEALLLSAAGIGLAFVFHAVAAAVVDLRFAAHFEAGASASHLDATRLVWIIGLAFVISLIPAILAGGAVAAIDPGDELRDV